MVSHYPGLISCNCLYVLNGQRMWDTLNQFITFKTPRNGFAEKIGNEVITSNNNSVKPALNKVVGEGMEEAADGQIPPLPPRLPGAVNSMLLKQVLWGRREKSFTAASQPEFPEAF